MFSFHLTTRILINQKKIDMGLFNFLLRGNTSLDPAKTKKTVSWLSDANWKDLELLQTLDGRFKNFMNDLDQNEPLWRAWYDNPAPEDITMPCGYDNLEILQKICVIKVFRIDRLKEGISMFVVDKMGPEYVKPS
jgi:dynein heavy chain